MSIIRQVTIQKPGDPDTLVDVNTNHSGNNELFVSLKGHVCAENTTTTTLGAGGVFDGDWQDTLDFGIVVIGINTDQNSAVDGLVIQWSADAATVHDTDVFTITANQGKVFTFGPARRYVKLNYTNGGTPQGSFSLETTLRRVYFKDSSHRIQDSIVSEDDASLVKAVLTGENPGGNFINFEATAGGNFKVSLEELENTISDNGNSQLKTTRYDSSGNEAPSMDVVGRAGFQKITDGTNSVDVISHEGDDSLKVGIGHKEVFCVHFDADNQSGTVGYMLIDLSDTTNWPHTNTNHIILEKIIVNVNQSTTPAFVGDLSFGFLTNVDATNGDYNRIGKLHGDRGAQIVGGEFLFDLFGFDLETNEWFGPTTTNDTTFQTDVNLLGPDETTSFPSGDGDFVMKLTSTAGTLDIAVTVFYTTQ